MTHLRSCTLSLDTVAGAWETELVLRDRRTLYKVSVLEPFLTEGTLEGGGGGGCWGGVCAWGLGSRRSSCTRGRVSWRHRSRAYVPTTGRSSATRRTCRTEFTIETCQKVISSEIKIWPTTFFYSNVRYKKLSKITKFLRDICTVLRILFKTLLKFYSLYIILNFLSLILL